MELVISRRELTENGVNTNDVCEKGRDKDQNNGRGHHQGCWLAIFQTASTTSEPAECPSNGDEEENDETNCC